MLVLLEIKKMQVKTTHQIGKIQPGVGGSCL
jgi:hypothetical protein